MTPRRCALLPLLVAAAASAEVPVPLVGRWEIAIGLWTEADGTVVRGTGASESVEFRSDGTSVWVADDGTRRVELWFFLTDGDEDRLVRVGARSDGESFRSEHTFKRIVGEHWVSLTSTGANHVWLYSWRRIDNRGPT